MKVWQGHAPLGDSRGESVPCLLLLLVASSIPWYMAASFKGISWDDSPEATQDYSHLKAWLGLEFSHMAVSKPQSLSGCWPGASIPYHMGLSSGHATGFPTPTTLREWTKKKTKRKLQSLYDLASEVTYHHIYLSLLVTQTSIQEENFLFYFFM